MPTMENNNVQTLSLLSLPNEVLFVIFSKMFTISSSKRTIISFAKTSVISYRLILEFLKRKYRYYTKFFNDYIIPVLMAKKTKFLSFIIPMKFYFPELLEDNLYIILDYFETVNDLQVSIEVSKFNRCYHSLKKYICNMRNYTKKLSGFDEYNVFLLNDFKDSLYMYIRTDSLCMYNPQLASDDFYYLLFEMSINISLIIDENGFCMNDNDFNDLAFLTNEICDCVKANYKNNSKIQKVSYRVKHFSFEFEEILECMIYCQLLLDEDFPDCITIDLKVKDPSKRKF